MTTNEQEVENAISLAIDRADMVIRANWVPAWQILRTIGEHQNAARLYKLNRRFETEKLKLRSLKAKIEKGEIGGQLKPSPVPLVTKASMQEDKEKIVSLYLNGIRWLKEVEAHVKRAIYFVRLTKQVEWKQVLLSSSRSISDIVKAALGLQKVLQKMLSEQDAMYFDVRNSLVIAEKHASTCTRKNLIIEMCLNPGVPPPVYNPCPVWYDAITVKYSLLEEKVRTLKQRFWREGRN